MSTNTIKNAPALTDLELYEVLVAAYPEKFGGREESDDLWNEVMDFTQDLCDDMDETELRRLIGRLVFLTMPMQAAVSGQARHALGKIETRNGQAHMTAAVSRPVVTQAPAASVAGLKVVIDETMPADAMRIVGGTSQQGNDTDA